MNDFLSMIRISNPFDDRPYESQVILLVSGLAMLRVFIAVSSDLINHVHDTFQLINEFTLFFVFIALFWFAVKNKKVKNLSPFLGVFIIFLLAVNFIQFGGTAGTSEFNYFSGIYLIVILYSGRNLFFLLGLQLLTLAALIIIYLVDASILSPYLVKMDIIYIDFIFSLVAICILTYFLKKITLDETYKLGKLSSELSIKASEMKRKNHQLIEQGKELKALQQYLENEIKQRSSSLEAQNNAIEKYIQYNTDHLNEPLQKLTEAIKKHPNSNTLDSLLHITSNELNQVVIDIKETLEKDGHIDRNKIKRS